MFEAPSRTLFLAQCFLVWDCFSDGSEQVVVQFILISKGDRFRTPRNDRS